MGALKNPRHAEFIPYEENELSELFHELENNIEE